MLKIRQSQENDRDWIVYLRSDSCINNTKEKRRRHQTEIEQNKIKGAEQEGDRFHARVHITSIGQIAALGNAFGQWVFFRIILEPT